MHVEAFFSLRVRSKRQVQWIEIEGVNWHDDIDEIKLKLGCFKVKVKSEGTETYGGYGATVCYIGTDMWLIGGSSKTIDLNTRNSK